MASSAPDIHIERRPEEVWDLISDFGDLSYMPGVESVTVEGELRTVKTMGMEIEEHLVAKDDAARSFSYSIVGGVPVDSHQANVSVRPDGEGSRLVWEVTVTPDDALDLFVPVYEGSLKAIKAHLEDG